MHFLCARLNVHDHVHLMKKASKEDREKTKKRTQNERKFAYSQCYLKTFVSASRVTRCGPCTSVFKLLALPMKAAHLKTPHISSALGKISLTRKNLGGISRYFPLLFVQPILDGAFKWRTSWHITTAACTAITSF